MSEPNHIYWVPSLDTGCFEIWQTSVSCREGENQRMAESTGGSEEVEAHYRIMTLGLIIEYINLKIIA